MKRREWLVAAALSALGAACLRAGTAAGDADASLSFRELYKTQGVLGMELSDKTRSLAGRQVQILGYMAPPLKPEVRFFVLTRAPVALCPFCNSDADWPSDIVVVYPREGVRFTQDGLPVAVTGNLEIGSKIDGATGFVSFVRVVDATVAPIK